MATGLRMCGYLMVVMAIMPIMIAGHDYSNSYISPNSARHQLKHGDSEQPYVTSGPEEIHSSESKIISESPSKTTTLLEDPIISKTTGFDDLLNAKNVDQIDSNDVELSGRMVHFIQPSKTLKEVGLHELKKTEISGEDKGAPKGRSVPLEPHIKPTATMHQNFATQSHQPRQVNPDIQDIITGLVKLLNGKVNVQANTALPGRPLRPMSSRINNRGPPRITDVPALPPDFDMPPPPPLTQMTPPVSSTKVPTPYPFDIPPQNTSPVRPFPMDKIIPVGSNKRPQFYRPVTIPPWNRIPQRRPPNRRPLPYHPLPPRLPPEVSFTSEKPNEDILNFDSELDGSIQHEAEEEYPTDLPSEEEPHHEHNEASHHEDNKAPHHEDNEAPLKHPEEKLEATTIKADTNETFDDEVSKVNVTTTVGITNDTSAVSTSSEPTTEVVTEEDRLNETSTTENPAPLLESSIPDVLQTLKPDFASSSSLSSTPTESLSTTPTLPTKSLEISTTSTTSTASTTVDSTTETTNQTSFPYYPYRPRPGIVLDDTEFRPGRKPIITSRPQHGDIFDITVSAIQGPGGSNSGGQGKPYVIPVDLESLGTPSDVILTPQEGQGFVSIDGKRTYLNLFGDPTTPPVVHPTPSKIYGEPTMRPVIHPTQASSNSISGTGYAVVDVEKKPDGTRNNLKPTPRRPSFSRIPTTSPVRIDTCIVGDDSTCDGSQHEICRTEAGVSACYCRPGYARRQHRDPCRKVVSVLLSLRVDRLYDNRVLWASDLSDQTSPNFRQLSYETEKALESAMSMTRFSDEFLSAKVNTIYKGNRAAGQAGVFVNLTLQLEENAETARPQVKAEIQKHLLGVIQRRGNNIGDSAVWVDSPPGSVSNLQDVDECSSPDLHDCHSFAKCINTFGGFKCECGEGFRDPWVDSRHRAGRQCEQCSSAHCNNRGECKYQNGQEVCVCSGNYYGNQCELDGEVLGVAIGASVAAVVIIGLTLICLVMWTRRWSKEQKASVGSPVFGYMGAAGNTIKTPVVGGPPYQLTLEDRMRWAQIADAMAQANHYAPEPVNGPTRPSSAVFGYPGHPMHGTMQHGSMHGTMQHGSMHGTLPPIPLPRLGLQAQLAARAASVQGMRPLDNSSSSEEEDKTDLLGRNFQVPRPKSRSNASIANQSGIYYDVDYEQHDIYSKSGIPMSTYAIGRPYFRN